MRGWIALIGLTASAAFALSLIPRLPWFDTLFPGDDQANACTLKYARHWYAEGASNLRWTMLDDAASVELPTPRDRHPYVSYLPGAVFPSYAAALARGREPSLAGVMVVGLASQLALAAILSISVFLLLLRRGASPHSSFFICLVPMALALFLPGPLYWHQQVYFADTAVVLPFAAVLLLEVIGSAESARARRIARILQPPLVFAAILCEWLGLLLAAGLIARRWAEGQLRGWRIAEAVGPPAAALALFALQLSWLEIGPGQLLSKFMFRSGWAAGAEGQVLRDFWAGHVEGSLGRGATLLLWGSGLALLVTARRCWRDPAWSYSALALAPALLHLAIFQNHAAIHPFAAIKLLVPLAAGSFIFAPLLVVRSAGPAIGGILILGATALLAGEVSQSAKFFRDKPDVRATGESIRRHARFSDVVFSPDFEVAGFPAWISCFSLKNVYRVKDPAQIDERMRSVEKPNSILMIYRDAPRPGWHASLGEGRYLGPDRLPSGQTLHYYRIER